MQDLTVITAYLFGSWSKPFMLAIAITSLNTDNTIELERTKELIELSRPLEFTFHRAFDKIVDPIKGLEELIEIGVDRVLTSGQEDSAIKGIGLIEKLIEIAANRIAIMPGSGVRSINIKEFIAIGANEIHGSFSKNQKTQIAILENVVSMIKR